jgi:ADP-dependent NAD(P)H-hydrate dehydratase / NAD(P)H-hydrate epimerase
MVLRRISGERREALFDTQTTRRLEAAAIESLPPHTLMARAGLSVARLAIALHPHVRRIWVACGPGNNGGDGLIAAIHLHRWAKRRGNPGQVVVTLWAGDSKDDARLPPDAQNALFQAREAGLVIGDTPPDQWDLAIDAMLGIGGTRAPTGAIACWRERMRQSPAPTLHVDLPSGLNADTGQWLQDPMKEMPHPVCTQGPQHTLSLLTLKPCLFTADGRDACGEVWHDDLQTDTAGSAVPTAWLAGRTDRGQATHQPLHVSHKGSFGDVVVVGGQDLNVDGAGMTGAALLAARSALHGGAGRVYVGLLESDKGAEGLRWDPAAPELMLRRLSTLLSGDLLHTSTVVCGCGGGASISRVLPAVLSRARRLVLDADALNAIANDTALQALLQQRSGRHWFTVLTPHPLEAARLLNQTTAQVQENRLRSAGRLAEKYGAVCVLKGSGTVISAPGQPPLINPTGNGLLGTAGTGDVLAGLIASAIARREDEGEAALTDGVARAVFQHGWLADHWGTSAGRAHDAHSDSALSAGRLAERVRPIR